MMWEGRVRKESVECGVCECVGVYERVGKLGRVSE